MKKTYCISTFTLLTYLALGQIDTSGQKSPKIPRLTKDLPHEYRIFATNECEAVSKSIIKKYEKHSSGQFEKMEKNGVNTETKYEFAEFLRHKGDTAYKVWYINFIDITRAEAVPGKNKTNSDCILLFKVAKAYYYTGNFRHAKGDLSYLKSVNCSEKCIDYYLDLVNKILSK